ncbi:hypothetical protein JTB14_036913 [Gonioctena quinquepunctata]|nr:hypothetical protein JTB14_036913 [Gonioctena quinquepunctata]
MTNGEVLRIANRNRELLKTVKYRKMSYLGHVVRENRYGILLLSLSCNKWSEIGVGRERMSWLKKIREWTGIRNAGQLFDVVEDREAFAMVIATVGQF